MVCLNMYYDSNSVVAILPIQDFGCIVAAAK